MALYKEFALVGNGYHEFRLKMQFFSRSAGGIDANMMKERILGQFRQPK